jgi:hypothetical protein
LDSQFCKLIDLSITNLSNPLLTISESSFLKLGDLAMTVSMVSVKPENMYLRVPFHAEKSKEKERPIQQQTVTNFNLSIDNDQTCSTKVEHQYQKALNSSMGRATK